MMLYQSIGSRSIEKGNPSGPPAQKKKRIGKFDFKDDETCGVVFGCEGKTVMVGLVNFEVDEPTVHICSVDAPDSLTCDFARNWVYAVVGSKLFTTGPDGTYSSSDYESVQVSSQDVYFCDLQKASSTTNYGLQFELAAKLNSPKLLPLVVPYKKKKIFFISNPHIDLTYPATPCEVLHLSNNKLGFSVKALPNPPFWNLPDVIRRYIRLDGHAILGSKLYVRVRMPGTIPAALYCFDMETERWHPSELHPATATATASDGELEDCVPLPHMLKDVYQDRLSLDYVHSGKLFKLKWEEYLTIPCFCVVNLMKKDDDHNHTSSSVDLKGVIEFMNLGGQEQKVLDGWVLPCYEEPNDVFCLMIWTERWLGKKYPNSAHTNIKVCKFELGADGSCNILSKMADCGPFQTYVGLLKLGFTPAINKELHPGNYLKHRYVKKPCRNLHEFCSIIVDKKKLAGETEEEEEEEEEEDVEMM